MKEIVSIAENIFRAKDRDPADAKAMLHQIDHDHGHAVVLEVIARMQVLSQARYDAAMAVFEGLPPNTSFGDAVRIKQARKDPVADGWELQDGGNYVKTIET
jgi:hypothetical protein